MYVDFHHRSVDAQLLAVFQAELDRTLDHGLVDGLHGGRGEPVEGAVEGIVLGHAMAVEYVRVFSTIEARSAEWLRETSESFAVAWRVNTTKRPAEMYWRGTHGDVPASQVRNGRLENKRRDNMPSCRNAIGV